MHYLAPLSNEDQDHAFQSTVTVQRHEAQRVMFHFCENSTVKCTVLDTFLLYFITLPSEIAGIVSSIYPAHFIKTKCN